MQPGMQDPTSLAKDRQNNTVGGVKMTTSTIVEFDGGTRPTNPGPSAIGYIVKTDDSAEERSEHIGESTNNRAEYHALIRGLEVALEEGCSDVEARGDSELIVKQVRGEYDVNKQELRPFHDRVQELADEFDQFEIQHISREENIDADELVDQVFLHRNQGSILFTYHKPSCVISQLQRKEPYIINYWYKNVECELGYSKRRSSGIL